MSHTPLPLRPYQIADLEFHLRRRRSLNLSDPGTGKTPTLCVYIARQCQDQDRKAIWVMPTSLLAKNRDELLRFTTLDPGSVVIVDGPAPRRARLMAADGACVFLMGFEILRREWRTLLAHQPRINALVVDELHMAYSRATSLRTRELFLLMDRIDHFVGMTGTLIRGRLDAAFPALHIISPKLYPDWAAFHHRHVDLEDDYGNVVLWKNLKPLRDAIARISVRHTFAEIHGPEARVTEIEAVPMGPGMRRAYDRFHHDAMLALQDRFIDGTIPAVAVTRARQIMAHPETFGLCRGEVSGKDQRLLLHLAHARHTGEAVILYTALVPEQERIFKLVHKAGLNVALINGTVPASRRRVIDADFRAGRLQAVVASPQTAATGFNWGHAAQVIFASMDYEDTSFLQACRRALRGPRPTPLRITVLQYDHSIDQRITEIVERKAALAHRIDPTRVPLNLTPAA